MMSFSSHRASCIMLIMASVLVMFASCADTDPVVQSYKVQNVTNKYCLMMDAGLQLHFNYTVGNETKVFTLNVPSDTNRTGTNGTCGKVNQTLVLSFNNSKLEFTFMRTKKDLKYAALVSVQYNFSESMLPGLEGNDTYTTTLTNMTEFESPAGKGFLCMTNKTIRFNSTVSPLVGLDTIKLRVEAFRTVNGTTYNEDYTQCEDDNRISNIVPIAVGAALGALVLVVLIAYLVGRKRNQRGYETV